MMNFIENGILVIKECIYCVVIFLMKHFIMLTHIIFLLIIALNWLTYEMTTLALFDTVIFYILFSFFRKVYLKTKEEENKIPTVKERFTKKLPNGDIEIEEGKLQMAMIYLSLLEDYVDKNK